MRLRLGLLRDTASIDRLAAKDAAKDAAAEAAAASKSKPPSTSSKDPPSPKPSSKPRIRPLSESKAIDMGANFISEAFLFLVGGAVIVNESFRSRRREHTRREDVTERLRELEDSERAARRGLVALEEEVLRLRREKEGMGARILPREVWESEDAIERVEKGRGWWAWRPWQTSSDVTDAEKTEKARVGAKDEEGQPLVEKS